jgi:putative transposase
LLALRRAVAVRCPSAGLIHHADRGSQYCSVEYQAELRKNGISSPSAPSPPTRCQLGSR